MEGNGAVYQITNKRWNKYTIVQCRISLSLAFSLSLYEWNILRCITQKIVALMNFRDARHPVAVFIKFEAMVARICNEDVSVLGERQTLWTVQRITGTIHTLQIRAEPIENLLHIHKNHLLKKISHHNCCLFHFLTLTSCETKPRSICFSSLIK